VMVYTASHPMGPWAPQTSGDSSAQDIGCVDVAEPLHSDGYEIVVASDGAGSNVTGACRDDRMQEPPFFVNHGAITSDQCAAYCTSMLSCTAFAICASDEECAGAAGSCHLYVNGSGAPDQSSNWEPQNSNSTGNANHISRVTSETWWRCYRKRGTGASGAGGMSVERGSAITRQGQGVQVQGTPTPGQGCLYGQKGAGGLVAATRAQQNFVITVPLANGETAFIWTGDRWQQAPDGLKGHEGQFWAPLEFDVPSGMVKPIRWVDAFTLDLP